MIHTVGDHRSSEHVRQFFAVGRSDSLKTIKKSIKKKKKNTHRALILYTMTRSADCVRRFRLKLFLGFFFFLSVVTEPETDLQYILRFTCIPPAVLHWIYHLCDITVENIQTGNERNDYRPNTDTKCITVLPYSSGLNF